MPAVLTTCPFTEDLVPTGLSVDSLDELPSINHLQRCPSCSGEHDWTPTDAALAIPIEVPVEGRPVT